MQPNEVSIKLGQEGKEPIILNETNILKPFVFERWVNNPHLYFISSYSYKFDSVSRNNTLLREIPLIFLKHNSFKNEYEFRLGYFMPAANSQKEKIDFNFFGEDYNGGRIQV